MSKSLTTPWTIWTANIDIDAIRSSGQYYSQYFSKIKYNVRILILHEVTYVMI